GNGGLFAVRSDGHEVRGRGLASGARCTPGTLVRRGGITMPTVHDVSRFVARERRVPGRLRGRSALRRIPGAGAGGGSGGRRARPVASVVARGGAAVGSRILVTRRSRVDGGVGGPRRRSIRTGARPGPSCPERREVIEVEGAIERRRDRA